jgi:hypothetical protein
MVDWSGQEFASNALNYSKPDCTGDVEVVQIGDYNLAVIGWADRVSSWECRAF